MMELKQKGVAGDVIERVVENIDDEDNAYRAGIKKARNLSCEDYGQFRRRLGDHLIASCEFAQLRGFAKQRRPGKEKGDFHVEDNEQQGDDVESQVILYEARTYGRLAAFVNLQFLVVRVVWTNESSDYQVGEQEHDPHGAK